jgi:hypothetical protein
VIVHAEVSALARIETSQVHAVVIDFQVVVTVVVDMDRATDSGGSLVSSGQNEQGNNGEGGDDGELFHDFLLRRRLINCFVSFRRVPDTEEMAKGRPFATPSDKVFSKSLE